MGPCVAEIAVCGPSSYFFFMGCANWPLCRLIGCMWTLQLFSFMGCANDPLYSQNACMWALQLFFLHGVC
jgi:hypothetical protein